MKQLSFFADEWREYTDLGGRCSHCLDSHSWLIIDKERDDDNNEVYLIECQSPIEDIVTGEYLAVCGNTKSITTEFVPEYNKDLDLED